MEEKVDWRSISVGLLIVLVGSGLVLGDVFWSWSSTSVWISVGCSLIASGLVILLTALLLERRKYDPLDAWKIQKIYSTRAERNSEADPNIDQARYCIDGIAFGLSTFRTMYGKKIEQCLRKGVNIRLLTMDPEGEFICVREEEEETTPGAIKETIVSLVKWANDLNQTNPKGRIVVKAYKSMTLDYYWRVDDDLYVGPYWYESKSSDTITYKFVSGGRGFQHYSEYFEKLWEDQALCRVLTTVDEIPKRKKRKIT